MRRTAVVILLLAGVACATNRDAAGADTLSQRQRDSVLAASKVPGASGVGAATRAADSAAARRARDSAATAGEP